MSVEVKVPKKLIEVALPLDAINRGAAKEKSIRHGHPANLHRWWARRPLAAARAVIFSQMVNDPGYERRLSRGLKREDAHVERIRLFKIIEKLVQWENIDNEEVLQEARIEIRKSWKETCNLNKNHPRANELFNPDILPSFYDPFAGGGAIPLEAQRLGLNVVAGDLNPVAVAINKAMVEIPSRFNDKAPVCPLTGSKDQASLKLDWTGMTGLTEDIRRYGELLRKQAIAKLAHLYPTVEITLEHANEQPELKKWVGKRFPVLAWIWARTVRSPNPAFSDRHVPLMKSFALQLKKEKQVWLKPRVNSGLKRIEFSVTNTPPDDELKSSMHRTAGRCLFSGSPIALDYIANEAKAGNMGQQLVAIVAEAPKGRVYLPAEPEHEGIAKNVEVTDAPTAEIEHWRSCTNCVVYGLDRFEKLFTKRQLFALVTMSDIIPEIVKQATADAVKAGFSDSSTSLSDGGDGAHAYGEAIGLYLALVLSKSIDSNNALCPWEPVAQCSRQLFGRQAIPMLWDFAEANPLHTSSGGFATNLSVVLKSLESIPTSQNNANALMQDATTQTISKNRIVCTDPPYYDNVPYSNLSDFFYIWLKRSLSESFPELFSERVVPRANELVANRARYGGKPQAQKHFLNGMHEALKRLAETSHPAFPVTIFYAFKQSNTDSEDLVSNTGWDTFLDAVIKSGFTITGTWPMRTESTAALKAKWNALASSVVLVCNKRKTDASSISRRDFLRELNAALPNALHEMTQGGENSPIAPVDLSQAIIGPGMAIFSKYSAVLEADGKPMSVRDALQLINRFIAEDDFDPDTQFCIHWFESFGWDIGKYGEAEVLTKAKGTSIDGLRIGGVLESSGGKVRLFKWNEFPEEWVPESDNRLSIWEVLHQLIRKFRTDGERSAGELLAKANRYSEPIRSLAYRLYTNCERRGWAKDAGVYNELIQAWENIDRAAQQIGYSGQQMSLFNEEGGQNL